MPAIAFAVCSSLAGVVNLSFVQTGNPLLGRCRKDLPLCDLTELKQNAPILNVKLSSKLFDLFQHCELRCNAGCCGWDAFDLSDRWLSRWCDFRDATTIAAARADIVRIRDLLDGYNLDAKIDIHHFFAPTVATLTEHLDLIDNALATHDEPDDRLQA